MRPSSLSSSRLAHSSLTSVPVCVSEPHNFVSCLAMSKWTSTVDTVSMTTSAATSCGSNVAAAEPHAVQMQSRVVRAVG